MKLEGLRRFQARLRDSRGKLANAILHPRTGSVILGCVAICGAIIAFFNLTALDGQLGVMRAQLNSMNATGDQTERAIGAATRLAAATENEVSITRDEEKDVHNQAIAAEGVEKIAQASSEPSVTFGFTDTGLTTFFTSREVMVKTFENLTNSPGPNSTPRVYIAVGPNAPVSNLQISYKWRATPNDLLLPNDVWGTSSPAGIVYIKIAPSTVQNDVWTLSSAVTSADGKPEGSIGMPVRLGATVSLGDVSAGQTISTYVPADVIYALFPFYIAQHERMNDELNMPIEGVGTERISQRSPPSLSAKMLDVKITFTSREGKRITENYIANFNPVVAYSIIDAKTRRTILRERSKSGRNIRRSI